MRFVKLNNDWDAEPNAPMPKIEVDKESSIIKLSFYLNSFIHSNVNEEDLGVLEFNNCYKYRIGPTNDEGFYRGECRFSKTGIEWGNFYIIEDSDWREEFPKDEIIVNEGLRENTGFHHYLFYFRDQTYECITTSYNFRISKADD